jgi:hypothetical protein
MVSEDHIKYKVIIELETPNDRYVCQGRIGKLRYDDDGWLFALSMVGCLHLLMPLKAIISNIEGVAVEDTVMYDYPQIVLMEILLHGEIR